jgi:hypothetical protein
MKSKKQKKEIKPKYFLLAKDFHKCEQWLYLRKLVFNFYPKKCLKCNSDKIIQLDHIKPKSKYPKQTFDILNLQPLCSKCNYEKSNIDMTDYRTEQQKNDFIDYLNHIGFNYFEFDKNNRVSAILFTYPRKAKRRWIDILCKHPYYEQNMKIAQKNRKEISKAQKRNTTIKPFIRKEKTELKKDLVRAVTIKAINPSETRKIKTILRKKTLS